MNSINGQNLSEIDDDFIRYGIRKFLVKYPRSSLDCPELVSVFNTFVRYARDPPLDMVWFHAGAQFHKSNSILLSPQRKLLFAEYLLQILPPGSSSCSVIKEVAMVAPVLFFIHSLGSKMPVVDLSLTEGIVRVVERLISHISSHSKFPEDGGKASDSLGVHLMGVIRIWTVDRIGASSDADVLAAFFPLVNKRFLQKVDLCIADLAGVVMNETLFLRLYLEFYSELNDEDLQRDVLNLAIQIIRDFRNFYFIDILFEMLLEPSLPIAALLRPEEKKVILQTALYDAVMMQNLSYSESRVQSGDPHAKQLALQWVFVADKAIQFARDTNDQARADSYREAFVGSCSVTELTEWACTQAGVVEYSVRPDVSTPKAFISWLLVLEDQGLQVFDDVASTLRPKALALLSIEEDIGESMSLELQLSSANLQQGALEGTEAGRKRKEPDSDLPESGTKRTKLDGSGSPGGTFLSLTLNSRWHGENDDDSSIDDMDFMD